MQLQYEMQCNALKGNCNKQCAIFYRGLYFFQKCQNRPDPYLENVKKAHTLIFRAQILAQNVKKLADIVTNKKYYFLFITLSL